MQGNDKISVIVPIYNIDRYLGICIESIINQTYKNLEIILVDDGSPDRCPEICDLYAKKDDRIKVIHKQNGGLVSARKTGILAATGSYVGYVDGDDWIGPGFFETLYATIATSESDVVCAGFSRDLFHKSVQFVNAYPAGIYKGKRLIALQENMLSYGDFYRPGITTYVWNKLFKRELLYKFQMHVDDRITIGEDAAVTYPLLMKCKSVYISDCVAYHYRQREDSMLKKNDTFVAEQKKLRYLYEYMKCFAKNYDGNLIEQVIDYVLGICIMRSGGKLPDDSYSTFNEKYYGKDIVVYSAGTFGQQLVNRFRESQHCRVVAWIDDDYWEYRRCCLDVDPVESILCTRFDYVLIASVDCRVARAAKKRLLDFGISESKVLTIECPQEVRRELLEKYLF